MSIEYFILTNAKEWKLFKVINTKTKKEADLIWECNISHGTDYESMAEDMFVISKQAYVDGAWSQVSDISKATDVGEIMALIYSDKFVKQLCRNLRELHDVRVSEETIQDILNLGVFKDPSKMNKSLLRKLNSPSEKPSKESSACTPAPSPESVIDQDVSVSMPAPEKVA